MLEAVDNPADSWYILEVDSKDRHWDSAAINESDVRDSMTNMIAHYVGTGCRSLLISLRIRGISLMLIVGTGVGILQQSLSRMFGIP